MDQKPWKEIKLYDKEKLFTKRSLEDKNKQSKSKTSQNNNKQTKPKTTTTTKHTHTQILFSILFMEIICD